MCLRHPGLNPQLRSVIRSRAPRRRVAHRSGFLLGVTAFCSGALGKRQPRTGAEAVTTTARVQSPGVKCLPTAATRLSTRRARRDAAASYRSTLQLGVGRFPTSRKRGRTTRPVAVFGRLCQYFSQEDQEDSRHRYGTRTAPILRAPLPVQVLAHGPSSESEWAMDTADRRPRHSGHRRRVYLIVTPGTFLTPAALPCAWILCARPPNEKGCKLRERSDVPDALRSLGSRRQSNCMSSRKFGTGTERGGGGPPVRRRSSGSASTWVKTCLTVLLGC